jgi:hypothetical protein
VRRRLDRKLPGTAPTITGQQSKSAIVTRILLGDDVSGTRVAAAGSHQRQERGSTEGRPLNQPIQLLQRGAERLTVGTGLGPGVLVTPAAVNRFADRASHHGCITMIEVQAHDTHTALYSSRRGAEWRDARNAYRRHRTKPATELVQIGEKKGVPMISIAALPTG